MERNLAHNKIKNRKKAGIHRQYGKRVVYPEERSQESSITLI